MLCIATISVITTITVASPVDKRLQQFDVNADCAPHQADAERIRCPGTQRLSLAAPRDVQITKRYVPSFELFSSAAERRQDISA